MAVPTTLHIGRPCMQCTPGRVHGPRGGGGGGRPVAVLRDGWGGGGGGGRVTVAAADCRPVPAHLGQGARKATCTLRRCRHTRTTSQAASHAVALSPARGVLGVLVLLGQRGATPGQATPHTTRHIPSGSRPAPRRLPHAGPGRGEGPVAPGEAPDGAVVGDTHPMACRALLHVVPPLDQEHLVLGGAGPSLRGAPPRRTGRGPRSQRGVSKGATRAGCVPSL